jgi:aminoglycoside phosphotransferase (APT) family kinase protein
MGSGDPAFDLAAAWMTFDATGRDRFRRRIASAGRYDEQTWLRAMAVSAGMSAITLRSPNPRTIAMGRQMIEQTLADRGPLTRSP